MKRTALLLVTIMALLLTACTQGARTISRDEAIRVAARKDTRGTSVVESATYEEKHQALSGPPSDRAAGKKIWVVVLRDKSGLHNTFYVDALTGEILLINNENRPG